MKGVDRSPFISVTFSVDELHHSATPPAPKSCCLRPVEGRQGIENSDQARIYNPDQADIDYPDNSDPAGILNYDRAGITIRLVPLIELVLITDQAGIDNAD
ncbi:hypothetical protein NDU88_002108 [Pleurodeles waltl]|uniref:Uncharacterized protein n=1 Tax=Pleurodeles waltl TaxID=8319 RepID=A0AAV7Q8W1_PLEWA|nr:hypothetical protein NDU88_002108 [Pleurodeles waltl]